MSTPNVNPRPLMALGVYDPLSAAIAAEARPDFLWLSSYCVAASQMHPDIGILPLLTQEQLISRITAVTRVPLIVDADNGGASRRYCEAAAYRLTRLGVAGICIEDKLDPKESSLYRSPQKLQTPEQFAELISTLRRAGPGLSVWARLEGLNHDQTTSQVVEKAVACTKAGADFLILHNTSREVSRLRRLIKACSELAPVGLIPTTYMHHLSNLARCKPRLLILANQILRAQLSLGRRIGPQLVAQPEAVEDDVASVEDTNSFILQSCQNA